MDKCKEFNFKVNIPIVYQSSSKKYESENIKNYNPFKYGKMDYHRDKNYMHEMNIYKKLYFNDYYDSTSTQRIPEGSKNNHDGVFD